MKFPFYSFFWFILIIFSPFLLGGLSISNEQLFNFKSLKVLYLFATGGFLLTHIFLYLFQKKINIEKLIPFQIFSLFILILIIMSFPFIQKNEKFDFIIIYGNLLLFSVPVSLHIALKMGIYNFNRTYKSFVILLSIKTISFTQIAFALSFLTYHQVFHPITRLEKEFLFINFLIQLPMISLFVFTMLRVTKPISLYFKKNPTKGMLTQSFRRSQILSYITSSIVIMLTIIFLIIFLIASITLGGIPAQNAILLVILMLLFILGSQLYSFISINRLISPILKNISSLKMVDHFHIRSPLSLRLKLGIWFGLLIFISIAFSAFFNFVQYNNLINDFLSKKAQNQLELLEKTCQSRLKYSPGSEIPIGINKIIKKFARTDSGYYYHLPLSGSIFETDSHKKSERLDIHTRFTMRNKPFGKIEILEKRMYGAFRRIKFQRKTIGVVAILYKEDDFNKFRGTGKESKIIVIFIILFFVGFTGVTYFIRDFTKPLKGLEEKVSSISSGKLDELIKPTGEIDEIGRLSITLEQMRTTIEKKITTIEKLNNTLETRVTERTMDLKKANEELSSALIELGNAQNQLVATEKLAALGKLLAGLSHEINNPVNAISNAIPPLQEILVEKNKDNKNSELTEEDIIDAETMIKVISRGSLRIREVIERISSKLRMEELSVEKVDISTVVENTLSILDHKLNGITVTTDIEKNCFVNANFGAMCEIIENLVANSIRALENTKEKSINIECKTISENIEITISDTGKGIPSEYIEKIFEPFFTTGEVGKGMGLGLSIVHDMVTGYKGKLKVESVEGKGTQFTVKLPSEKN